MHQITRPHWEIGCKSASKCVVIFQPNSRKNATIFAAILQPISQNSNFRDLEFALKMQHLSHSHVCLEFLMMALLLLMFCNFAWRPKECILSSFWNIPSGCNSYVISVCKHHWVRNGQFFVKLMFIRLLWMMIMNN